MNAFRVAAVFLSSVSGLEHFTESSQIKEIANDSDVWVIEYHHPGCGTCTEFSPIFKQLASERSDVKFAALSIEHKSIQDFAGQNGILDEGVPNLRILHTIGDSVGSMVVPIGIETSHIPKNFKETCTKAIDRVLVKHGLEQNEGLYQKGEYEEEL